MYPKSGYLCLTAAQLSNLVVLLRSGRVSLFDAKVYLGGIELAERREVAKRLRVRSGDKAEKLSRYSLSELAAFIREHRLSRLKRALKRLEAEGLLVFRESRIETNRKSLFPEELLSLELQKRGALSRLVPIPRRLLAELCRETKKSVFLAKTAYALRGLSLDRKSGELRSRGCIKASWIAGHFGLSIRVVRLARSFLIRSGFIAKDVSSFQRKLNRDGSYFEIDLSRYAGGEDAECDYAGTRTGKNVSKHRRLETVPAHSASESAGTLNGTKNPLLGGEAPQPSGASTAEFRFAPLSHENRPAFAPPREKQETPYGFKNQKTRNESPKTLHAGAGVFRTEDRSPNLRDIRFEDLRRLSTLRTLFEQAVSAKWFSGSESEFQNFVAAAVRVTRLGANTIRTDPVRVFVGIVRKKLWHHITTEQEERAREVISKFRTQANVFQAAVMSDKQIGSSVQQLLETVTQKITPRVRQAVHA